MPAKLIVSVGVSGAPQHWVGIKDCGSIVAVNTDAEAPLMRMADLPIQGDGLAFLKELGALISSTLTDAQKDVLKKTENEWNAIIGRIGRSKLKNDLVSYKAVMPKKALPT